MKENLIAHRDALNENGPRRPIYLDTWSPLSGTTRKVLWAVVLVGLFHCGWAQRFQKPISFPIRSLCLVLVDLPKVFLLVQCCTCLFDAMLLAMMVMNFNSLKL